MITYQVLIEPYWNVKRTLLEKMSRFRCSRINRTILECKVKNLGVPITESATY